MQQTDKTLQKTEYSEKDMYLDFSPAPGFFSCATKIFAEGEEHVTRRYGKSVLILMLENELAFREDGREIRLSPCEYYIQRDGLFQEGLPMDKPPVYFYIEFCGTYSEERGLPLRGRFSPKSVASLTERCESLYRQSRTDFFKLNSYLCRVLSELSEGQTAESERGRLAYRVRALLESEYHRPITLSELSERFGYDKDYLAAMFRERYGISPHRYLTEVRMEHAKWMLAHTELSAEQIGFAVGYGDFSAFFRNFKQTFGETPSTTRKNGVQPL